MDVAITGALIGGGATLLAAFGAEYYRRRERTKGTPSPSPMSSIASDSGAITAGSDIVIVQGTENVVNPRESRDSDLEIVRVDIKTGSEDDPFPILDITVRNRGTVSAVIHELTVDEVEIWAFRPAMQPSALPVSWRYDIDLGSEKSQVHRISQVVGASDADRFEVRLGTSDPIYPFVGNYLYLFRAALIIDAGRRGLPLGKFLVQLPQPMEVQASFSPGMSKRDLRGLEKRAHDVTRRISKNVFVQAEAQDALKALRNLASGAPD